MTLDYVFQKIFPHKTVGIKSNSPFIVLKFATGIGTVDISGQAIKGKYQQLTVLEGPA